MNITIYGKDNCAYCDQAKRYLDARTIPYEYKQLDIDFVREDVIAFGARSYPVIVINGNYIGGFEALGPALVRESATVPSTQFLAE